MGIFAIYTTDKELVSMVHKECINKNFFFNKKKHKESQHDSHFTGKVIHKANKGRYV